MTPKAREASDRAESSARWQLLLILRSEIQDLQELPRIITWQTSADLYQAMNSLS